MSVQIVKRTKKDSPKVPKATGNLPPIRCRYSEVLPISQLKPHPRNPNKHPKEQIELLAKIMCEQGIRRPIVVSNQSGFMVIGHGRLDAAKLNGWTHYPVEFQDYESEQQEYQDMVADNKIAELAKFDFGMFQEDLAQFGEGLDPELFGLQKFDFELRGGLTESPDEKELNGDLSTEHECPKCGYKW